MNKEIVFQTLCRWIASCVTHEQLDVAYSAVSLMYCDRFKEYGTISADYLLNLIKERAKEISTETDIFNLEVAGKD